MYQSKKQGGYKISVYYVGGLNLYSTYDLFMQNPQLLDEKIVILTDVSAAKPEEAFRQARSKEKTYAFDYAFDEGCG